MNELINFSRGVPDPASFPVAAMQEMTARALAKYPADMLQYGPAGGFAPLRDYLGAYTGRRPDELMVGNGSLELFGFLCEALLRPSDVVFVESPTYDRAITILRKHGVQIVGIPVGADGIDLAAFETALRHHAPKLVYLIPDFQNPTGACTPLAARRQIADWAEQRGFFIVEDGPYGFLRYAGKDITPFVKLAPARTIHLSSFTKLISPGVRIGFMVAASEIVSAVARVAESYYITPGYFAQGVIAEWCHAGHLAPQLACLRALYGPRLVAALAALERHLPQAMFSRPQGGFFTGLRLDRSIDEASLVARARSVGLILSSGDAFFADAPAYRFVRLPFCALSPPHFEEGVRRLAGVIGTLAPASRLCA